MNIEAAIEDIGQSSTMRKSYARIKIVLVNVFFSLNNTMPQIQCPHKITISLQDLKFEIAERNFCNSWTQSAFLFQSFCKIELKIAHLVHKKGFGEMPIVSLQ